MERGRRRLRTRYIHDTGREERRKCAPSSNIHYKTEKMEKASENQPLFSFSLFSLSGENFSQRSSIQKQIPSDKGKFFFPQKLNLSHRFHMQSERMLPQNIQSRRTMSYDEVNICCRLSSAVQNNFQKDHLQEKSCVLGDFPALPTRAYRFSQSHSRTLPFRNQDVNLGYIGKIKVLSLSLFLPQCCAEF